MMMDDSECQSAHAMHTGAVLLDELVLQKYMDKSTNCLSWCWRVLAPVALLIAEWVLCVCWSRTPHATPTCLPAWSVEVDARHVLCVYRSACWQVLYQSSLVAGFFFTQPTGTLNFVSQCWFRPCLPAFVVGSNVSLIGINNVWLNWLDLTWRLIL